MNINKLNGKIKIIYQNYPIRTHKLRKLYFSSPVYKNILEYLYGVIPIPHIYHEYKNIIPYLESLTPKDLEMLCELEQMGRLDSLITLIKLAAK